MSDSWARSIHSELELLLVDRKSLTSGDVLRRREHRPVVPRNALFLSSIRRSLSSRRRTTPSQRRPGLPLPTPVRRSEREPPSRRLQTVRHSVSARFDTSIFSALRASPIDHGPFLSLLTNELTAKRYIKAGQDAAITLKCHKPM